LYNLGIDDVKHAKTSARVIRVSAVTVFFLAFLPAQAQSDATVSNVILMISDGCGYNQMDAASLYEYGQTGTQPYEQFPVKLAAATFLHEQHYDPGQAWSEFDYVSEKGSFTDSAAAATAMSTGRKTRKGAIGLGPDGERLKSIFDLAESKGKATGVVTSVQFSHATPAGFAAHNESRANYEEIAREMIYESPLEVIIGCGHPAYDDDGKPIRGKKEYKYVGGKETWEDLKDGSVTGADADGDGKPDTWTVIQQRERFRTLAKGEAPRRLIGIATKHKTLQQGRSGQTNAPPYAIPFNGKAPTLAEMTAVALNVLDEYPAGFFLMVEGGAIDWAGHKNQSGRLIEEQIAFNKTVEFVIKWLEATGRSDQTLLIVTADHETGYLTGPGSGQKEHKPVWNPLGNNGKGSAPAMEWHSKDHTNSLVPFFAKGPGAERFKACATRIDPVRGAYLDNTDIAKVIFSLLGQGNDAPGG